ncbi:hypothetical protein GCM10011348_11510 [Marinobacterium nitratireducens]|uniref:Peptidoglycan binding-like domain-containing protein n=1 Tax=Marinobacterium nitratireducens TaxID=518897 RepID=A0A917ZAD1_9GAMM|nr:peptidoglycan-binding domain-containing protein [Marinobacterium nitratireducens]GGO78773.1 hypothetical protein GCM10011348_11510 [Marinobacterium nitratireducens]
MFKRGGVFLSVLLVSGCSSLGYQNDAGKAFAPQKRSSETLDTATAPDLQPTVAAPAYRGTLDGADLTAGVEPGQCWVYAQVKPRPLRESVEVLVQDSASRITVTPAELERGLKTVVTREGTTTYRILPAKYRQVVEDVVVRPEVIRYEVEPAVYEEKDVTVVVEEARATMEPCQSAGTRFSRGTGAMAFCTGEIPQQTRTFKRRELVKPEATRVIIEPAQTRQVARWVVAEPARAVPVVVDAETDSVEVQNLVRAETVDMERIPAVTEALTVTRYEGQPRIVSRRAVCDDQLSETFVRRLQTRLLDSGFHPGRIDGLVGTRTVDALSAYQVENGLAVGALTYESLEHLGIVLD